MNQDYKNIEIFSIRAIDVYLPRFAGISQVTVDHEIIHVLILSNDN